MDRLVTEKIATGLGGFSLLSLGMHFALYAILSFWTTSPDLGIEFQMPLEVEFGLAEETSLTSSSAGAPTEEVPGQTPPASSGGEGVDGGRADSGPDAGIADGGSDASDAARDGGRRRRDGGRDGGHDGGTDAETDAALIASNGTRGSGSSEGEGSSTMPAGAALVLRIDMAKIRSSPLANDVRGLLMAIPDWREILDGSGIDPLADLERLLIASPNGQRAQLMMAGRHAADETRVRAAVQQLAEARGVEATWREQDGMQIAPWANRDETARELALLGPQQFVITRQDSDDRDRLLTYARARAERDQSPADALLAMREDETVSLDVEGARRFARGAERAVPSRGRAAIRELESGMIEVTAEGTFEDEAQAETAQEFWEQQRGAAARNGLVRLLGMGTALDRIELRLEGPTLHARAELTPRQVRFLLGQLRQMLEAARREREREAGGPADDPIPPSPYGAEESAPPSN